MFRIKICGITNVEDALAAVEAGADAIGLNFYDRSPRCVSRETAAQIADALPEGVKIVGVFVNATSSDIRSLYHDLALDLVQLHGDEPAEFLVDLDGIPVLRAFRPDGNWSLVREYLLRCDAQGHRPKMALVDAFSKVQYGGTGETADWPAVKANRLIFESVPVVLAGGLTPENVEQAIGIAKPDAVDTASGVEASPGCKSIEKMQSFVTAAQRAFDLSDKSG
jgi:phosphoribosylanthranilate isomerase